MTSITFASSRMVATTVQDYFAQHITSAQDVEQSQMVSQPDILTIEAILDKAFWASLRREEGYFPKISLAFLSPEQATQPLKFEQPMPLLPAPLARLAPAVERPGIHLGVWPFGEALYVWGTTRTIPKFCFVVEVIEPGLLVVKYPGGQESNKFVNVAVINGNEVKLVDKDRINILDCPKLLSTLQGVNSINGPINVLVQLATSMREHKRGGLLLIVPHNTDSWRKSILQPIPYFVSPPFSDLAELMQQERLEREKAWQEEFRRSIDKIAGLTAVDGAVLISDKYDLLAFGAKIGRQKGGMQVEQIIMSEPVVNSVNTVISPIQLGGTRHLSAAQFVLDQQDSIALVASQDGHFTVLTWSTSEQMVHAYRVETLLL